MNKLNKRGGMGMTLIVVLLIVGGLVIAGTTGLIDFSAINKSPTPTVPGEDLGVDLGTCPTDGDSSVKFYMRNAVNDSGTQYYSATTYAFSEDGGYLTLTDTIGTSATTLNCGYTYIIKPVSTDGNRSASARITKVTGTGVKTTLNSDGTVTIKPTSGNGAVYMTSKEHGTIEFKAFDNVQDGWINATHTSVGYYEGGADGQAPGSTSYIMNNPIFHSVNSNSTAYDETNGIDITYYVRAHNATTDFNDLGTYILLDDVPVDTYATPTIKVNGQTLESVKGTLSPQEEAGWSGYDYIYFFDKPIKDGSDYIKVDIIAELLSGASASTDVSIDFGSKGAYLTNDGTKVNQGGVKDDTSYTDTYDLVTTTLDIT